MSTQKYVVLRAKSMDPNEILEAGPAVRGGGVSEDLEVNVSDLSRNDLVEVHRDTQTIGTAPSMPMILIEPLEGSEESIGQNGTTWGVGAVGATDSNFTGAGVDVAVLDTGIDAAHQAFNGVDIVEKDFTGEGNGDVNGHGTHCAGTIFGRDVDGLRIGVATGVSRAFVGKVIGENSGSTDSIFEGILWALNEGANVVSMSLGIDFPGFVKRLQDFGFPPELATSKALEGYRANVRLSDKLAGLVRARDAFSRGMLLVAAAGNESRRNVNPDFEITVSPPAAADGFISVGALSKTDDENHPFDVADFSNTGPNVAAPGVNVLSARPGGGTVSLSGTSMATPHVAGVAALWAERQIAETGGLSGEELAARLVGNADRVDGLDTMDIGAGLVKAP